MENTEEYTQDRPSTEEWTNGNERHWTSKDGTSWIINNN